MNENDQLTLELQRNNESIGETQFQLIKIYQNTTDTMKRVKFVIKDDSNGDKITIILLLKATKIGVDHDKE